MQSRYEDITSYITKDGSSIKELMHPDNHANNNQSLAEATVPPGVKTALHYHVKSEEIYHITRGKGDMTLGNNTFTVGVGDTILIRPNTPHQILNTEKSDLVFLCVCSPAYSHEDTILI